MLTRYFYDVSLGRVSFNCSQAYIVFAIDMKNIILLNGSRGTRPLCTYKPRVWRWFNVKRATNKSLVKVIDREEVF